MKLRWRFEHRPHCRRWSPALASALASRPSGFGSRYGSVLVRSFCCERPGTSRVRDFEDHATPGIGNVLAATIMLETGTITRFAGVGHFSFYCGCVESKWISKGKKIGKCNSKNGNKYLACAFIEAAAVARCAAVRRRDAFTNARRPSACPTMLW